MEDDTKSYSRGNYLFGARDCNVVGCYYQNKYYTASEFTLDMITEAEKLEKDLKHARDRLGGKYNG